MGEEIRVRRVERRGRRGGRTRRGNESDSHPISSRLRLIEKKRNEGKCNDVPFREDIRKEWEKERENFFISPPFRGRNPFRKYSLLFPLPPTVLPLGLEITNAGEVFSFKVYFPPLLN